MNQARNKRPRGFLTGSHASMIGIALAIAILAWTLPASARADGGASVSAYGSLATIRPDRDLPSGGGSSISLMAARNEYRSAQVVVSASGPLPGVDISIGGELTAGDGATISSDQVTVYREAYYSVQSPSDAEGEVGSWPDALIPEKDSFYGEDRNAFPVDVPASGRVVAWIDVLVPTDAVAGTYLGTVEVDSAEGHLGTIPITMVVKDFTLPSTSTLASSFPLSAYEPCTAHSRDYACGYDENQRWELAKLYAEAGLNNRVTISNPFPGAYGDSGEAKAPISGDAREKFERYILPLIQGTDPGVKLSGAKLTSVLAYGSCARAGSRCLADWRQLAEEYGFADRFSLFVCDEPYVDAGRWGSECKPNASRAERVWPGVDKLVTTDIGDAEGHDAVGQVDTLVPLINQMADKSGELAGNQRSTYESFLGSDGAGASKRLWMYTSCQSYGCKDSPSTPQWNGWAGYAIDQPAAEAEAMGWLSFAYGATGELYYNAGQSLHRAWADQFHSGGNGDGNLFYAGTPNGVGPNAIAIGGEHDIPIESMRLKRIRDGRQAYEYLHALAARGRRGAASRVVGSVFGNLSSATFNTDVKEEAIDRARARLARMITGGLVQLHRLRVPRQSVALSRRGIEVLVSCKASCRVNVTPVVTHGEKGRLGIRSPRLGRASARIGAHRRVWVRVPLSGPVRRRIDNSKVRLARVEARVKASRLRS